MKPSNSQERLKELMETLGISQADICKRTGLEKATLSLYVNGKREPRQNKISQISEAYDIDPAWLMGYDVPMKREKISVMTTASTEIRALIEAFAEADEQTKRLVLYALKLNDMAKKYED